MPLLAERYQLGSLLWSDADVVAYEAHDQLLNREVTVELLQARHAAGSEAALRLLRKAHDAALRDLPYVAALYDQNVLDGRPFLVWEGIAGPTIAQAAPLPATQAIAIVDAVAQTLKQAAIRQQQVPTITAQSVRWGSDERVQILDLGLHAPEAEAAPTIGGLLRVALGSSDAASPLLAIADRAERGQIPTVDALREEIHRAQRAATVRTTVVPRTPQTIDLGPAPNAPTIAVDTPRRTNRWWLTAAAALAALLLVGALMWRSNNDVAEPDPTPNANVPAASRAPVDQPAENDVGRSPAGPLYTIQTNNGQGLIVRSGPGRAFDRVTSLPNGSTVEVLSEPQAADGFNWVRIRAGSVEGWSVSEALRPQ